MKLKGMVVSGVHRGEPLIDIYFLRLVGLLGFEPFRGTLDIKLEKPIDITLHTTKTVEQILMDGSHKIDAYLAPIIFTYKGEDYNCWAMVHETIYTEGVIEVVAKDNLKEKFILKDGDEVEITFTEEKKKEKRLPGMDMMKKLYGKQDQLMKS